MAGKLISRTIMLLAFTSIFPACDHAKTTARAQSQAAAPAAAEHPILSFPPDNGPLPTFEGNRAMQYVKEIVDFGPRPLGSASHKKVEDYITAHLKGDEVEHDVFSADTPEGKFPVHNIVAKFPGRKDGIIVMASHYDTNYPLRKTSFVGANDGASGTAVVYQLARALRPRTVRPTVVFVFFDGEEAPDDSSFEQNGTRGSRVAAQAYRRAQAMILLDMIGDRSLAIPKEQGSNERLFARVRASASRVGVGRVFAGRTITILDDHLPFARAGVPSVDLIDFSFPCWHKPCDDLTAVSAASLDVVGETVSDVLRGL